jgi:TetR/AcrR family transcriptional regulator, ethionamide resistance regulator
MRIRLMNAALNLMAVHGPAGTSIDDVIAQAQVSRGSFYKYFETPADLVSALAQEVSNEMLKLVDPLVLQFTDPAERIAAGIRLMLRVVRAHPVLGSFIVRLGWPNVDHSNHLFYSYVARDIRLGMRLGQFERTHLDVALNLVAGSLIGAVHTVSSSSVSSNYPDQMAICILRGLGVKTKEAQRIIAIKLASPRLASDSIFSTVNESLNTD